MCHASLKIALLLHKVGLVKRLMSTTVVPYLAPKSIFEIGFYSKKEKYAFHSVLCFQLKKMHLAAV